MIDCVTHGRVPASFVCSHILVSLSSLEPTGCIWVRDQDGCINAYCDACGDKLEEEGSEWNDAAEEFAKIRLICEGCFEKAARINGIEDIH